MFKLNEVIEAIGDRLYIRIRGNGFGVWSTNHRRYVFTGTLAECQKWLFECLGE